LRHFVAREFVFDAFGNWLGETLDEQASQFGQAAYIDDGGGNRSEKDTMRTMEMDLSFEKPTRQEAITANQSHLRKCCRHY